ncbi:MAG: ABC transporter permease [Candidatus Cloacimonetes bacterium]|nr:ABC transporter permease [Candidatus Cloacimonadota bacterium]
MLSNYLKIAFRNMVRHKIFTFINLAGLILGIAAFLLIITWVGYEMSFDRFNTNSDRIQRLCVDFEAGSHMIYPMTMPAAAPLLLSEYPEVENAARLESPTQAVIKIGEETIVESGVAHGDNSLFEIFTFPFVAGDATTALLEPYTAIITESMAKKYFKDKNPLGEVFQINGKGDYTVTGVIRDIPQNSHFRFNIMGSFSTLYAQNKDAMENWFHIQFFTYLLLAKDADAEALSAKFPDFIDKYLGARLAGAGASLKFFLQPLTSIHLHSDLSGDIAPQADNENLLLFIGIAVFILVLACINYINLSTATIAVRAREIGLRKTFGSSRRDIIRQFLLESILFCFTAMIAALALVEMIRPHFRELFGTYVDLSFLNPVSIALIVFAFPVCLGLLSAIYPSLYMSTLQPVTILIPGFFRSAGRSYLRSILVIFQFSISIILIIATLTVYKQINYMKQSNPGFKEENVIEIPGMRTLQRNISLDALRQAIYQIPEIEHIGFSSLMPGRGIQKAIMYPEGFSDDQPQMGEKLFVDAGYIDAIGIELLTGRNFSFDMQTDPQASVLINESAAQRFGWRDPIGKMFTLTLPNGESYKMAVIGMVKDFHSTSLRSPIEPLVIYNDESRINYMSVRSKTEDTAGVIKQLEKVLKKLQPDFGFRYYFLDELLDQMYGKEQQTARLASYFSIISILLGCLGLFGLTTFILRNRTKEIGIRKVMGASMNSILLLLVKDFCKWILLAIIISLPVSAFLMNNWLQKFAYRTEIGLGIFALSAVFALLVAIITISFQTVRMTLSNPIKALKYE